VETRNLFAQSELPICPPKRRPIPLDLPTLLAKPTYEQAFGYVVACGNFEHEKELFMQLDIDAGNWTRIKKGDMALAWQREKRLEELCGNKGLTIWRAFQWGCELRELQDSKDKRIADLESALAEQTKKNEVIEEFVRRTSK
jgi:hypothetical protein